MIIDLNWVPSTVNSSATIFSSRYWDPKHCPQKAIVAVRIHRFQVELHQAALFLNSPCFNESQGAYNLQWQDLASLPIPAIPLPVVGIWSTGVVRWSPQAWYSSPLSESAFSYPSSMTRNLSIQGLPLSDFSRQAVFPFDDCSFPAPFLRSPPRHPPSPNKFLIILSNSRLPA